MKNFRGRYLYKREMFENIKYYMYVLVFHAGRIILNYGRKIIDNWFNCNKCTGTEKTELIVTIHPDGNTGQSDKHVSSGRMYRESVK